MQGASGSKVIKLAGNKTSHKVRPQANTPADLLMQFKSPAATGAQILLFAYSPDTGRDSFYFSVNDGPIQECHLGIHPQGRTKDMGKFSFKKGVNTLKIWTREYGVLLDKFTLKEIQMPRISKSLKMQDAVMNNDRVELTDGGIRLKSGVKAERGSLAKTGDVEFTVTLPPGRY